MLCASLLLVLSGDAQRYIQTSSCFFSGVRRITKLHKFLFCMLANGFLLLFLEPLMCAGGYQLPTKRDKSLVLLTKVVSTYQRPPLT